MAEKEGSAVFVRCPSCAGWFTASAALIDRGDTVLYCPQCTQRFLPQEAAEIDRP